MKANPILRVCLPARSMGATSNVKGLPPQPGAKVRRNRRKRLAWLFVLGLAALPSPDAVAQPYLLPLYSWLSESREDNLTSANPAWAGAVGQTLSPDYSFLRVEGEVFHPGLPQPADTVPLYRWYSPSRGDNFITTAWPGNPGDIRSPDYRFVQREGYIFSEPRKGTLPLFSWYSPSRGDNLTTTLPAWASTLGDIILPDYYLFRIEGYVYAPVNEFQPAVEWGGARGGGGRRSTGSHHGHCGE